MKPLKVRNGIPFYYDKSDNEFRHDVYEQFDTTVLKNARRYFSGNDTTGSLDYLLKWLERNKQAIVIVENGCGIAFHIAMISKEKPESLLFAYDYSYQMLSMAMDLWLHQKPATFNLLEGFFDKHGLSLDRKVLKFKPTMQLALAKCENLPLEDAMVDVSYSCYLWDRITNHDQYIIEQARILRTGGYLIIIGPMSFTSQAAWEMWYPLDKLIEFVESFGFELLDQSNWEEKDVFDGRNNHISWQVEGFCFVKRE